LRFIVDRKVWAMDGRQRDLEAVFGSAGVWGELLGQVAGYEGTEIWCESPDERQYRVRDTWWSHHEFEFFRARYGNDVERLQSLLWRDGIASKFEFVGAYYDERSDGDDLVAT
jgi:hypothetical protein